MKRFFIVVILLLLSMTFSFGNEKPIDRKVSFKFKRYNPKFEFKTSSLHQIILPTIHKYSSDTNENSKDIDKEKNSKKENKIMKDVSWDWFKAKNRLEKVLIALGTILTSIGLPFFVIGLVSILSPSNANTQLYQNLNYAFIGIGSGLMATAPSLIIVGAIRIKIKNKKQNTQEKTQTDNKDSSSNDSNINDEHNTKDSATELE